MEMEEMTAKSKAVVDANKKVALSWIVRLNEVCQRLGEQLSDHSFQEKQFFTEGDIKFLSEKVTHLEKLLSLR